MEAQTPKKKNGLSTAGFICSLCGFITCGITSIIGLILSIIGLSNSKKEGKSDGLAIAGIVIGAIPVAFFFLAILAGLAGGNDTTSNSDNKYEKGKDKVIVVDFSTMSADEIDVWCNDNKINCVITTDYSDTVEKDMFISQSVDANKSIYQGGKIEIKISLGKEPTVAQKNAVKKAQAYLRTLAFSREGLIKQLEFEGFTHDEAVYGVDNIEVDWNEQAAKKAKSYLSTMAFSREGLIKQLEFEGFTYEQAVYGVEQNGL